MKNSKLLAKHAFILDVLCLILCFALLFLGNKDLIPYWMLVVGALIAFVALIASLVLFIKARKIDREENRRIEREILEKAAMQEETENQEEVSQENVTLGSDDDIEVANEDETIVVDEAHDDYKNDDE